MERLEETEKHGGREDVFENALYEKDARNDTRICKSRLGVEIARGLYINNMDLEDELERSSLSDISSNHIFPSRDHGSASLDTGTKKEWISRHILERFKDPEVAPLIPPETYEAFQGNEYKAVRALNVRSQVGTE